MAIKSKAEEIMVQGVDFVVVCPECGTSINIPMVPGFIKNDGTTTSVGCPDCHRYVDVPSRMLLEAVLREFGEER